MNLELSKEQVADARDRVRKAVPKGWKVRVHKYAGGLRCVVHQAPVDLLGDLKAHGLNLGACGWFESSVMYPFAYQMEPKNGNDMERLYDAMLDSVGHLACPVYLAVGSKDDPFNHAVKPPKQLHPKVKAYADYAKAMAALNAKEDAKRLIPNAAKKLLKLAHHSWA